MTISVAMRNISKPHTCLGKGRSKNQLPSVNSRSHNYYSAPGGISAPDQDAGSVFTAERTSSARILCAMLGVDDLASTETKLLSSKTIYSFRYTPDSTA